MPEEQAQIDETRNFTEREVRRGGGDDARPLVRTAHQPGAPGLVDEDFDGGHRARFFVRLPARG